MNSTNDENNYTVYMHKNKINDKVYIGITSKKPEERWKRNGYGYIQSKYFKNAIDKYGWDNFEHIILYTNLSREQAEQYEIDLIKQYDSTNRKKGYNIQHGGRTQGTMNEESKRKISEANKGKSSWIKGKHHSEETKKKISEVNTVIRDIFQYDRITGDFINWFHSLEEAYRATGISKEGISSVCSGKVKSRSGYIFRYRTNDINPYQNLNDIEKDKSKNTHFRPIKQYTKDGTFIKEYNSIVEAEHAFGKEQGRTLIWHCVNHIKPSALGYLWSYSNEDVVIPIQKRSKPVIQYDLDKNIINKFSSVKEASKYLNVSDQTLIIHLKNENEIYKNYIWKYA